MLLGNITAGTWRRITFVSAGCQNLMSSVHGSLELSLQSDGTTFNCICKNGYSGSGCGEYMSGPMTWAEMPSTVKDYIQGYPSTITLEYLLPGTYNGHSYPAVFRSFALECLMLHGRQGGGTCMWHWIQEVVSLAAQGQWEIPFSHEALVRDSCRKTANFLCASLFSQGTH